MLDRLLKEGNWSAQSSIIHAVGETDIILAVGGQEYKCLAAAGSKMVVNQENQRLAQRYRTRQKTNKSEVVMKGKHKLMLPCSILLSTVGGLLAFDAFMDAKALEEEQDEWSYGGSTNQTRWGELSEDFAICDRGRNQSPVNLEGGSVGAQARIQFNYQGTPLVV